MQNEKWLIQGKEVIYNDDKHAYYVDGKRVVSVTQLLKFKFPTKYDGITEEILKQAAERGSYYHECLEMYEKYGLPSNEIEEFRNYLFLKEKFKFKVIKNEIPILLTYKDLVICGRLDMVIEEGGKRGLADAKFTAVADKEYLAYQLNLYRLAYQQSYNEEIELIRGIHLKKSTRKYITLPINEELTYQLLDDYIKFKEEK